MRVYQPLSGLHQPVVVDVRAANLKDVNLTVHCVPGGLLSLSEASVLCQKVQTLFENQGAQVRTVIAAHEAWDDTPSEEPQGEPGGGRGARETPTAELTLELRARKVHEANNPVLWALCIGTFTLVPAVTESTFAQDVLIRDGEGFLLVSDTLQGRLVQYFGVGTWLGNKLLDMTWRSEEDKLTGAVVERDLSTDLYRQLSQLVFNAKVQWQVLQQSPARRGG